MKSKNTSVSIFSSVCFACSMCCFFPLLFRMTSFLQISKRLDCRTGGIFKKRQIVTIKVLIGITPQGSISFVSEAWGGRTSDKFLTENCGILSKLVPGDMMMADRGFTIHESIAFKRAKLVVPAFTKGKEQLDPVDVETTRAIANVRIHVERVIDLLRRK